MNRFLINYIWDIMDIGAYQKVDNSVARDMFVTNLNNHGVEGAEFYAGAAMDYEKPSEQWKAMSAEEQAQAKTDCKNCMQDCYKDLVEARKKGDSNAFYATLAAYNAPEAVKPTYLLYKNAWEIWDKAAEDGTDLATAKDAYVETLEGWGDLTDEERNAENDWFAAHVTSDDRNLVYARTAGNRVLFDGILAG